MQSGEGCGVTYRQTQGPAVFSGDVPFTFFSSSVIPSLSSSVTNSFAVDQKVQRSRRLLVPQPPLTQTQPRYNFLV